MIPDYQSLMRPVLEQSKAGEIAIGEVIAKLSKKLALSKAEQLERIPSGRQTKFANRVHWARTYLKQAGLLKSSRRGYLEITEAGKKALQSGEKIDNKYLQRFESFQAFRLRSKSDITSNTDEQNTASKTPEEMLRNAHKQIESALAEELIERLQIAKPAFFEQSIVQLMLAMGYGNSKSSGSVIGGSGDDGVDGVIDQDPLGVDQVYLQAKRYQQNNRIGAGAIREFYGALSLKDVSKGIFVTTSTFTASAIETANKLGARIILIDGLDLAHLMIKHGVGCRQVEVYKISEIDEGFFE